LSMCRRSTAKPCRPADQWCPPTARRGPLRRRGQTRKGNRSRAWSSGRNS